MNKFPVTDSIIGLSAENGQVEAEFFAQGGSDSTTDWLNSTKYGKLLLALIGRKSTGIGIFVV